MSGWPWIFPRHSRILKYIYFLILLCVSGTFVQSWSLAGGREDLKVGPGVIYHVIVFWIGLYCPWNLNWDMCHVVISFRLSVEWIVTQSMRKWFCFSELFLLPSIPFLTLCLRSSQHPHTVHFYSSHMEQFKISMPHDETGMYEKLQCTVNLSSVTYRTWKNKLEPGRAKKLIENIF